VGELLEITRAMPDLEPVGDGWTVGGIVVPYATEQRATDDGVSFHLEETSHGAYARDCRGAPWGWVQLRHGHGDVTRDRYLGRCVNLSEREDGLWTEFRINREHPLAEEARSGGLTGWSVSAIVERFRDVIRPGRSVRVYELCSLRHVAATASPQYAGAGVMMVREQPPGTPLADRWREKYASPVPQR